jgi:polyphenol oxidase
MSTTAVETTKGVPLIEHQFGSISYLQFDLFQQFPEMTHGVFMRMGGCSAPPFAGLNAGRSVNGDKFESIAHNRTQILQALNLHAIPAITLWQVHGSEVATYRLYESWRSDWAYASHFAQRWRPEEIRKGDAIITQERGMTLALSFADCVPIIFYDPKQRIIGIAHGGWRGTARGIALATIEEMHKQFGCEVQDIHVGIGPAIGDCCYEVSTEVHQFFMGIADFAEMPTAEHFRELVRESAVFSELLEQGEGNRTSLRLNLQATNRKQLLMTGIPASQIEVMEICTSCNTDRFFSHRAEQGNTGRFAVLISLLS